MFPAARVSTLVFLGIFITIVQLPALIVIGFFIVLQVIDGLAELRLTAHQATANIAYFAHIFGFAAGILLLLLIRQRREQGRFRFG
jgi:membrane associated rhomboid family serine protease